MLLARELTEQIIGLAIEVHRLIGPVCCNPYTWDARVMNWHKLTSPSSGWSEFSHLQRHPFRRGLPRRHSRRRYLVVEIKAAANLVPAHDVRVLTYLRMSGLRVGLLFHFHARLLKDDLRRFIV